MIAPTNFLTGGGLDSDSIREIAKRPMDAARKIQELITVEGKTLTRLTQIFFRSAPWIQTHKLLLYLHPDVQKMIPAEYDNKGRPRTKQKIRSSLGYCFAAALSSLPLDKQKEVADKVCAEPEHFKTPQDVKVYVSALMKGNGWKKQKHARLPKAKVQPAPKITDAVASTAPAVTEEILEFPSEPSDADISHKFVYLIDELEGILEKFEHSSPEKQEPSLYSLLQKIKLNPRRKLMAYMRKVGLILYYAGHDRES